MARMLLVRGMITGLVAGLLALVVARVLGEPQVGQAIAFESAQAEAAGRIEGPELVSRAIQSSIGLATGVGVYGVALGGLFALAFAVCQGRIGPFGVRTTSGLVALGGFIAVALVPFVKYPANPPAIGRPETIGQRTSLYFLTIAVAVLLAVAAVQAGKRLSGRYGRWNATLIAIGGYLAAITVVFVMLPEVNEVPADFPATVLWRFRLSAVAIQLTLWATLGLLFGVLAERLLEPGSPAVRRRNPVSVTSV